jgi:hypothetical protein
MITGLERFRARGQSVPDWVLGGGTALMIHTGHRLSKDIDAFIADPQFVSVLSPRLAGEDIWSCDSYDEAANHLKLAYPEGGIDFIVAPAVTAIEAEPKTIDLSNDGGAKKHTVNVEHPVETAIKKLKYRGALLTMRDIFDIAVVDARFSDRLRDELRHLTPLKAAIMERLSGISDEYCRQELGELAIAPEWRPIADICLARTRQIAETIPAAASGR